jgi:hypothetical protein
MLHVLSDLRFQTRAATALTICQACVAVMAVAVGSLLSGHEDQIIVADRKRPLVNPRGIPDNPARPELRLSLAAPKMCSSF